MATSTTIDGKTYNKGDSYTDSSGRTGTVNYDTKTGSALSNPVVSSTSVRADNTRTGADIKGLQKAYASDTAMLQQQQAALAERRNTEVEGIKTDFEIAKAAQESGQAQDYASRSTSLITSGGGFLGGTQSQQGVLQNLQKTFDTERTALMAKREAAINAANIAYEDKDFALAREMSKNAKELQGEIYSRQKDYADQTLALSRENRAQTEFDMGITDKKISAYSLMSDEDFAKQNPNDIATIDSKYYPGYTNAARTLAKKALEVKTSKDAIDLDSSILDMQLKVPQGQKFTLGGKTYTGLKKADGLSSSETTKAMNNDIAAVIMDFQNQIKTKGWAGVNPDAYEYYRNQLAQLYGASAALELDKSLKALDLSVDYNP